MKTIVPSQTEYCSKSNALSRTKLPHHKREIHVFRTALEVSRYAYCCIIYIAFHSIISFTSCITVIRDAYYCLISISCYCLAGNIEIREISASAWIVWDESMTSFHLYIYIYIIYLDSYVSAWEFKLYVSIVPRF